MSSITDNVFLSRVCHNLRQHRPKETRYNYSVRSERVDGLPYAGLWFRTRGCSLDRQGACTFCNYGCSEEVSTAEMVDYVRQGLAALDITDDTILLVTPSGSLFDEGEVPAGALEGILALIRQTPCRAVICETRAETVTEDKVRAYALALSDKAASLEIGLESADPWVLKYCANKRLALDEYSRAVKLLIRHGVTISTTILLGHAFLSAQEAIDDTVQAAEWAFEQGVNRVCIFPGHVKTWTLLEWLWSRRLYSPPSLWSLIEVIRRLGPKRSDNVYSAWYKFYDQEAESASPLSASDLGYLCSPSTCGECQDGVMSLLDQFRDRHSFDIITELVGRECRCKQEWRRSLEGKVSSSREDRVSRAYAIIGQTIFGSEWWSEHAPMVLADLQASRA